MPGAQPAGKRMAIHARKLALEPDLQIPPRHRRPLLRCLEQAHRSALAHHVARPARLGPWVLIKESWYEWQLCVVALTRSPRRRGRVPFARSGHRREQTDGVSTRGM